MHGRWSILLAIALVSCIEQDVCHARDSRKPLGFWSSVFSSHDRALGSQQKGDGKKRLPIPRDFPNGAKDKPRSFSDYEHLQIKWGDPLLYIPVKNIGHGTYADAYMGHVKGNASHHVVIKQLKHSTWYKIRREVLIMQAVRDGPFTVRLLDVVPHLKSQKAFRSSSGSSSLFRHLQSLPGALEGVVADVQGLPDLEGAELSEGDSGGAGSVGHEVEAIDGRAGLKHRNLGEGGLLSSSSGQHGTGTRALKSIGRKTGGSRQERRLHTVHDSSSDTDPGLLAKVEALSAASAIDASDGLDRRRPVSLIVEAVPNTPYELLVHQVTLEDIRRYTRQLVEALEYAHSRGVMHRDVKVTNTFMDHDKKRLVLGDWGLGEFYFLEQSYRYSVSTRAYKAPELLLKYNYYNYAIDMWGVGMHLASFVFARKQIFGWAENERGMLNNIAMVRGYKGLEGVCNKYSIPKPVPPIPNYSKRSLVEVYKPRPQLATPDCLDLIEKLLTYDPEERITATEALQHPFLRGVPV